MNKIHQEEANYPVGGIFRPVKKKEARVEDKNEYEKVPGTEMLRKRTAKERVYDDIVGKKDAEEEQVDHPSHYNQGNIEVIDFIDDQEHLKYNRLQALRYICRSGAKSSESKEVSIKKAIWYLERELGMHKKLNCNCKT